MIRKILGIACLLAAFFPEAASQKKSLTQIPATAVLEWNVTAYEAMGENYQHVLNAARVNAMTHLAIHDAVNAVQPLYKTYALKEKDPGADVHAAIAQAAYTVLSATCPAQQLLLDEKLARALAPISDGDARERGIALGRKAAEAILKMRAVDGSEKDPIAPLKASSTPGMYQTVPPFDFVFAPHWAQMKSFGLARNDQFRVPPPPALTSEAYARDFNEVLRYGAKESAVRSSDATFYAKFWYEFSEIGWNRITRVVTKDKQLSLPEAARLFALVNMALADSYIGGWDSKLFYNCWRPYTAIRQAAIDGNDQTAAVTDWEPLMPTPPIHDYPSTHSALGNAAATVLTLLVGDHIPFTMTSTSAVPAGSTRTLKSFMQAADENADSRVMAGIHFRFATRAGQELGNKIGAWTVKQYLQKL